MVGGGGVELLFCVCFDGVPAGARRVLVVKFSGTRAAAAGVCVFIVSIECFVSGRKLVRAKPPGVSGVSVSATDRLLGRG